MDEMDLKILAILSTNARQAMQGIAKKLKVSEGTIRNRISKMEGDGTIVKYSLSLEPRRLGFNANAIVALSVEPANFLQVISALAKLIDIRSLITCTGDHSIIFEVWKKDSAGMNEFLEKEVRPLPGVSKVSPYLIVERIKRSVGPLAPE